MHAGRPCAKGLHIAIAAAAKWRTPRPPTPRRSKFSQQGATAATLSDGIDPDAPPVPPLSYWEPDTPETLLSPLSPRNPFLSPPPIRSPMTLFPTASPLLPASPLSIFDYMVSPTTPSFLMPRISPSPTSPRFLRPRTPPIPSPLRSSFSGMEMSKKSSTKASAPHATADREKGQYQSMYEMVVAARDRVLLGLAIQQENTEMETKKISVYGKATVSVKAGAKEKAYRRMLREKRFKVVRDGIACK